MVNEVVTEISIGNKNLKHLMSVHDLFRTQFSVSRNHYKTLKSILYYRSFCDKSFFFLDNIWTVPLKTRRQFNDRRGISKERMRIKNAFGDLTLFLFNTCMKTRIYCTFLYKINWSKRPIVEL